MVTSSKVSKPKVSRSATTSIPIHALQESLNHVVCVEAIDGSSYEGILILVEPGSGNVTLEDVYHRRCDLSRTFYPRVLLRGSHVRLISLPAVLKGAPFFTPPPIAAGSRGSHQPGASVEKKKNRPKKKSLTEKLKSTGSKTTASSK